MPEDSFKEFVLDQLAALPEVRAKAMFGAHGMYSGENFFAIAHETLNQRQAAAIDQLHAYFIKCHAVAETLDHGLRLARIGQIKGYNETVAGGDYFGHDGSRNWFLQDGIWST